MAPEFFARRSFVDTCTCDRLIVHGLQYMVCEINIQGFSGVDFFISALARRESIVI